MDDAALCHHRSDRCITFSVGVVRGGGGGGGGGGAGLVDRYQKVRDLLMRSCTALLLVGVSSIDCQTNINVLN